MTAIVIYGDVAEGYTFVGPFESAELAAEYLEKDKGQGRVETLYEPDSEGFDTEKTMIQRNTETRHREDYDPEKHKSETLGSFTYKGITFVAHSGTACRECAFSDNKEPAGLICGLAPNCTSRSRSDSKYIFWKVKE